MQTSLKEFYPDFPLKDRLTEREFVLMAERIVKTLINTVLEGGRVRTGLGTFRITKVERSFAKPTINWPESNKLKKEILERGDTPLKGDNGGEPWHVYYTDNTFYRWNVGNNGHVQVNGMKYRFVAARGIKRELSALLKDEHNVTFYAYEDN